MRVFFIGFGQAGGKLVDMFLAQDRKLGSTSFRGIVINTARTDLMGIKNIPMEDRLLIGQTMVKGHGVGTDNVTGAKVAADEIDTIISAIDQMRLTLLLVQSIAAVRTTSMHLLYVRVLAVVLDPEDHRFSVVT